MALPTLARRWTAADLRYDPVSHTTTNPNGDDVPHVTRILNATGISLNFSELAQLSPRLGRQIAYRRDLGSAFHADSHALDDGDLDWSTVHPDVAPYLDAWQSTKVALELEPLRRERQVYHHAFRYTGIMDGIFKVLSRKLGRRYLQVLIDLKLGDPDDAGAQYQLAAYDAAHKTDADHEIVDELWAIQILPQLAVPYKVTNYSSRPAAARAFSDFTAFLTTFRCQRNH